MNIPQGSHEDKKDDQGGHRKLLFKIECVSDLAPDKVDKDPPVEIEVTHKNEDEKMAYAEKMVLEELGG